MFIYLIFTIAYILGCTNGQPIIPSYAPRYQLVYLTPPYHINQYLPARIPQPVLQNRITPSTSIENNNDDSIQTSIEDEKYEVSQFHSEDANGRIVFGFHSPDQMRMEARDIDGSVRGSYSYIDPNGNIVKMQYWDDGNGFHAAGNNIPVAVHNVPDFTPEVKEARENHLRLYQAAVAALNAANSNKQEADKDENGYIDTSHYENGDEYEDAPPEGGVIIENPAPPSSVYADSISSEYPKVQLTQTNQLNDNNNDYNDEDKESVSIENPEFKQAQGRMGENNNQPGQRAIATNIHDSNMDQTNQDNQKSDPNRAFFYQYIHTIPKPIERIDDSKDISIKKIQPIPSIIQPQQQQQTARIGSIHDSQIPQIQYGSVPNYSTIYLPQAN